QFVNKKVIENLAKAGALDKLAERNQVLMNLEMIISFAKMHHQIKSSGQSSLFGGSSNAPANLQLPSVTPASDNEKMAWEKELLGVYLSSHPFEKYSKMLDKYVSKISDLDQCQDNQLVCVAGLRSEERRVGKEAV